MSQWDLGAVILGEYTIEKELGRGGMGRVWLVKSNSTGRRFAVKQALIRDEKHRKAFLNELQTWIDLPEHPNIVPCRFFRTVGDEFVIFADYIEGGSLADWITKGKLASLEQILDVAIQFAWGLHAIHERGLIHQDVKPANVLMTPDGMPMVTDFGLARARLHGGGGSFISPSLQQGQQSILVSSGGMTPAYASPEQRNGKPLSRKTDIWSWGVSVLDMLVGGVSCPHGGQIAADVLEAFVENGQEDERLPDVPEGLSVLLRECFAARPEERAADFAQVVSELQALYSRVCGVEYANRRGVGRATDERGQGRSISGRYARSPDEWLAFAQHAAGLPVSPVSASTASEQGSLVRGIALMSEACPLLGGLLGYGRHDLAEEFADASWVCADLFRRMGDWRGCLAIWEDASHVLSQLCASNASHRKLLAVTLYWYGQALVDSGDPATACDICQRAMDILVRLPFTLESLTRLAQVYQIHAKALQAEGRDEEARVDFRDAVAALQEFADQFSEDIEIQRALSLALHNWAGLEARLNVQDTAIDLFERAIHVREALLLRFPNDDLVRSLLAGSYSSISGILAEVGRLDAAFAAIDKALAIRERLAGKGLRRDVSEGLAMAHFNKGGLLLRAEHTEEALAEFSLSMSIFVQLVDMEGQTDLVQNLALCSGHVHEILSETAARDPVVADRMYAAHADGIRRAAVADARGETPCQLAALLSNWAGVKETLGQPKQAATLLREAIKQMQGSIHEGSSARWQECFTLVWFNLGTALHKTGDKGSAVDAWMTCVRRCMEWNAVQKGPPLLEHLGRGSVALAYHEARCGDYMGARARLGGVETAVREWGGDNTPGLDAVLASVADLRRQIDAHQQHDRERSTGMEAGVWVEKALALRASGQVPEALAHYRKALELDPNVADIWVNYGAACGAAGDDRAALDAFNKAIGLTPGHATAWHNKGAVLFQQGRYEDALPALEKAYALGHQSSMNALAKCKGMLRRQARLKEEGRQ